MFIITGLTKQINIVSHSQGSPQIPQRGFWHNVTNIKNILNIKKISTITKIIM